MQPITLDAKHLDGLAFLLQLKYLGIGEKKHSCFFSCVGTLLALRQGQSKSSVVGNIYGCLYLSLVRSVARSIMGREGVTCN